MTALATCARQKTLPFEPVPERVVAPLIIGDSMIMRNLKAKIERLAQESATVLIVGETGVGKELFARALHYLGPRHSEQFVCVNCPGLSAGVLESELFGHEKGAFTGADRFREGRFELADGGTILLDEVSEIDTNLQAKLLRVLQERTFERVGSSKTIGTSARIVATTNRNLEEEVRRHTFRRDLYFRLSVVPIRVPPLMEHTEDIPALAAEFIRIHGSPGMTISQGATCKLMEYDWPGNIRQLKNMIERACVLTDVTILQAEHLVIEPIDAAVHSPALRSIEDMERDAVRTALSHFCGHQERAARSLGISSRTLRNKIRRYGFERQF